ncbi:MAG: hypothetical protein GF308_13605 [Candidatus Heimdallarchaeota archaeon]|nr:hypothetical protein [Candidatus Heimdallarchaeota archaeon]
MAKKPVYTKLVKESLKSIILSGESNLEKFVSHRILYFLGFITGWNEAIFSLEFLPLIYFLAWAIVLFSLNETVFAWIFLVLALILTLYFVLLHTVISAWDKIKLWFINRARERGGIQNMTLRDIKFLLIYTRRVFGVKADIQSVPQEDFNLDVLRQAMIRHRLWVKILNGCIIALLGLITSGVIYGVISKIELIPWLVTWGWIIIVLLFPLIIPIVGLLSSKHKIRELVNSIPEEQFDQVLQLINEFEILG